MSGFPNFFILLGKYCVVYFSSVLSKLNISCLQGPNAATGHTPAMMAAENSINYALRVIKPILDGNAKTLELRREAEERYVSRVQDDLAKTVWNSGCSSWYVRKDDEAVLLFLLSRYSGDLRLYKP